MHAGCRQRFHVHDAVQVIYVRRDEINVVGGFRLERFFKAEPPDILQTLANDFVRAVLNPFGGVGVRGSAVRGVVFETAVIGRIVGRRNDHPIRQSALPAGVVGEDGMRNHRRRGVAHVRVDHNFHAVARKNLNRAVKRRLGQGVRVHPNEEGASDASQFAVFVNRLADGQHMVLIEAAA